MDEKELKKLPIAEVCINQLGFEPVKGKDCRSWRRLKSRCGFFDLLVGSSPLPNGDFVYKDLGTGKTSTLPFLLKQLGRSEFVTPKTVVERKHKAACARRLNEKALGRLNRMENSPRSNYLGERGIDFGLVSSTLRGAKSNEFGAVFPLFFAKSLLANDLEATRRFGIDASLLCGTNGAVALGTCSYYSRRSKYHPGEKRIYGKKGDEWITLIEKEWKKNVGEGTI